MARIVLRLQQGEVSARAQLTVHVLVVGPTSVASPVTTNSGWPQRILASMGSDVFTYAQATTFMDPGLDLANPNLKGVAHDVNLTRKTGTSKIVINMARKNWADAAEFCHSLSSTSLDEQALFNLTFVLGPPSLGRWNMTMKDLQQLSQGVAEGNFWKVQSDWSTPSYSSPPWRDINVVWLGAMNNTSVDTSNPFNTSLPQRVVFGTGPPWAPQGKYPGDGDACLALVVWSNLRGAAWLRWDDCTTSHSLACRTPSDTPKAGARPCF
mgnify:CR=1 FL=1